MPTNASATTPRKILIDTDPGIDDAMAIFYALDSPELDVVGLSTIFGNAHTATCTTNALKLLEIAGRTDIPVAHGASLPLTTEFRGPADFVHGTDGQGNVNLALPTTKPVPQNAAQFIIDTVMANPGEITLVALGPLTNIALAMRLRPDLTKHVRKIVLMGGNAFCNGNASPGSEANILNDPEAADIVFGADCEIVMAGLDVTRHILMTTADLAEINQVDNAKANHLAAILPYYVQFYRERAGIEGIYVHDSTTISYLLAPQHFEFVDLPIRVDTGSSVCRGKTQPGRAGSEHEDGWTGRRPVRILTQVDDRAVIELELSRLRL